MNIEEFLELSAGKWFSHRTSHLVTTNQSEGSKSDIIFEFLAADHPEVIKLCEQHEVNFSKVSCGAKVTWNGTKEFKAEKYSGSSLLVLVADEDKSNEGKLLHKMSDGEKSLVTGRYKLGSDEALTLTTESETMWSEERLWFASPNLRMRVSVVKGKDGFSMASFSSEIRMGGAPANAKTSQAANSASK
ncbi:phycobiliprotein lyase [Tolypothrix sp. PCC 7910]|uniref:phycobiliprotein lyase n=1 Tax=Tolypothrix sp. PCC 7910 TaxID=2099387 RepID=UPI0014277424|nr:phycobiliprotein lyase [Tolypothrix sp. PCC 7910]QIR41240.1 phycobiliprotein lyase [Tolypothrix sp. PCC 7910]